MKKNNGGELSETKKGRTGFLIRGIFVSTMSPGEGVVFADYAITNTTQPGDSDNLTHRRSGSSHGRLTIDLQDP